VLPLRLVREEPPPLLLLGERADGVLRQSNCTTMEQMIPTLRREASRRSVLIRRGRLSQRPHRTPKEELRRRADKQPAHAEKTGEEEGEVASHRRREDEVLL
jgi:hypothetical protein